MAGGTAPHGLEAALPVARPLPAGGTAPSARRTAKGGGERQPMESKQHAGVPSPSSADASRSGDPRRAERPSLLVRMLRALEVPALVLVPCAMAGCALAGLAQSALVMLLVVVLVLGLFFAGYEASRPGLRQIMPTLVLASLAAAGRILFAAVPDFKPVSAIAIIAGAVLGRRNGFMVGALAALTSNFFFGQGMWTPWQMYAWGLVGYVGGALAEAGAFKRADGSVARLPLLAYGFLSCVIYGAVINCYDVIGFVQPLTWAGVVARVAASLPFDVMHGVATVVFLAALYVPWERRLARIVRRYGLAG